jgi:hypothetical protein
MIYIFFYCKNEYLLQFEKICDSQCKNSQLKLKYAEKFIHIPKNEYPMICFVMVFFYCYTGILFLVCDLIATAI